MLYHCGLKDKIDQITEHSYVSIAAMPYITSQFMPRRVDDRPQVIPDGCVSLACIGQFVETPADVSFTVESSRHRNRGGTARRSRRFPSTTATGGRVR